MWQNGNDNLKYVYLLYISNNVVKDFLTDSIVARSNKIHFYIPERNGYSIKK